MRNRNGISVKLFFSLKNKSEYIVLLFLVIKEMTEHLKIPHIYRVFLFVKSTCLFSSLMLRKSQKYHIRPYFLLAKRRAIIGKFFLNDQRSHNICPLTDSGADRSYSFAEWGFLLSSKGVPAVAGDRVGTVSMQI